MSISTEKSLLEEAPYLLAPFPLVINNLSTVLSEHKYILILKSNYSLELLNDFTAQYEYPLYDNGSPMTVSILLRAEYVKETTYSIKNCPRQNSLYRNKWPPLLSRWFQCVLLLFRLELLMEYQRIYWIVCMKKVYNPLWNYSFRLIIIWVI